MEKGEPQGSALPLSLLSAFPIDLHSCSILSPRSPYFLRPYVYILNSRERRDAVTISTGMWNRRRFGQVVAGGAGLYLAGGLPSLAQSRPPEVIKQVEVYRQPGKYAGWPANHGAWQWGNELLVGFELGDYKDTGKSHAIDYTKPAKHVLARSLDGGENWSLEEPASLQPPPGQKVADVPTGDAGKEPVDCPGGVNFQQRGFIFTARMLSEHEGPGRFYYSNDRGKTWEGPFNLTAPGYAGIAARTDYIVLGRHDMLLFVTVPKTDGREGNVVVLRTTDGAKTWQVHGVVRNEEPAIGDFAIMPATIRVVGPHLVTAIRTRATIEVFMSQDLGQTWVSKGVVVMNHGGNPPSLVRTNTGQLVLVYGFREKPFGIRAKVSEDFGSTWGPELRLRTDGGGKDLGYVRTLVRPDGNLVSVYYYNDAKSPERYIGATIWYPGDYGYRVTDPGVKEDPDPQ